MRFELLESALLFILVLNTLRTFNITDKYLLIILAVALIMFIFLNLPLNRTKSIIFKSRVIIVILVAILIYGYIGVERIQSRIVSPEDSYVYDGVIITEQAYLALKGGQNPYSISFEEPFRKFMFYRENIKNRSERHYTYSPLMFLINTPIFEITKLFGFLDMRIGIVIFLFSTAFLSLVLIKEKILFLIIFFLNPLTLRSVLDGANEIFILFFLILSLIFLAYKKITQSTLIIALATSTKLLILPLIPLYFLYIYLTLKSRDRLKNLGLQIGIFLAVNIIIYLPFALWNFKDLMDDLLLYHIAGGTSGRSIAGFLGIPQVLASFGIISSQNSFPFILIPIILTPLVLFIAYKILKKSLSISTLCILFILNFLFVFSFSRIVQIDYLTFLSQIFIIAAFAQNKITQAKFS